MNFETYLAQAWNDHATETQKVADGLKEGIKLIEKNEQIPDFVRLASHVFGEHQGSWEKGINILTSLRSLPIFDKSTESEQAIARTILALELASERSVTLDKLAKSEKTRVLALAAAMLADKSIDRALSHFNQALEVASTGLEKADPTNRALAISSNNLAFTLEEKINRSEKENELMIAAAKAGRKYWEIAGTWLNVERAEYRLARSFHKAGQLDNALEHAQTCIEVCQNNNADAFELFFGYEILALVERARENQVGFSKALKTMKEYFEKVDEKNKSWCSEAMAQFK